MQVHNVNIQSCLSDQWLNIKMEENYIVVGENKDNVNSKVLNCNSFSEFIYDEIKNQGDNVYIVSIGMLFRFIYCIL